MLKISNNSRKNHSVKEVTLLQRNKQSIHELKELQLIKEWFPDAILKEDYNREILDIGAEIRVGKDIIILLKGPQTNGYYELVTPDCTCIEGLTSLAEVHEVYQKLLIDR
jgi:hypothetical protein